MPIVIDVEASGFGRGHYPIEVGVVLPDSTPHCFLISPQREWVKWDADAEKVHGISRDVLSRHGRPAEEVARQLNALLRHRAVYSDAWSFDMSWIGLLYDAVDLHQHFRIAALLELLNEEQRYLWDEVRRGVECELDLKRHRASGDARILRETLIRVQQLPTCSATQVSS